MNAKEFAQTLDGRRYGAEISQAEIQLAKTYGLAVVYGASDDLMEICGAVNDEADLYGGGTVVLTKQGIFNGPDCDCGKMKCQYFREAVSREKKIKAVWCGEGKAPWSYETDIPHETFNIYEDGGLYCTGIVFNAEYLE